MNREDQDRPIPVTAKAVVSFNVEVQLSQGWDTSCTAEQIFKQAARQAEDKLRQLFNTTPGIVIRGTPEVTGVLMKKVDR